MIYTLLRNTLSNGKQRNGIKKSKNGWGNDPDTKSIRIADDVERIRLHRNFTFHDKTRWLSSEDFDEKWNDLARVCTKKLPTTYFKC